MNRTRVNSYNRRLQSDVLLGQRKTAESSFAALPRPFVRRSQCSNGWTVLPTGNVRALLLRKLPAAPVLMDAAHREKSSPWRKYTGA
jgi:hypothetical protein